MHQLKQFCKCQINNHDSHKHFHSKDDTARTHPKHPKTNHAKAAKAAQVQLKVADKNRTKREALDQRFESMFNQPRVDRSSWQVPYPRMGKRSAQTMIPMARLGRSNIIPMARLGRSSSMIPMARLGRSNSMIPMARLGRSSQGVVIPMARMGRASATGQSMIPMARLGRSAPEKEEMSPLFLPHSGVQAEWNIRDILTDPDDVDTLLDIMDEILDVIATDKQKYPNLLKFIENNLSSEMADTFPESTGPEGKLI